RRIVGQNVMLSHVQLAKGFKVDSHQHENEQFACVLHGKIKFTLGEGDDPQTVTLRDGETLHLPSNVVHSAEALEETVIIDVFVPPSEGTGIDRKS
ncbi:MAG: cupin domain-containing protein, partial [Phycisphaerae bacterium]